MIVRRNRRSLFVLAGPLGVTLWRGGALSLQAWGHFLQIVIGDWWQPRDERT